MSEKIEVDFSPEKVLAATKDIGEKIQDLSRIIEESLGKQAPKSINKLEETAEKGSSRIASYFSNLGHRVKEDLKTAFDATGVLAGAKFAEEIGKGVKSVFDLEQAFSRLNSRLKMTSQQFTSFKSDLGNKVAATGQKTEAILPGVEVAAAKGGVKSAKDLAEIGGLLGQVKASTGEEAEGLSDTVVDILKSQKKEVTAASFKQVLDALQGARTSGAFKTAGEAGGAVADIAKFTGTKLSIREMAALSAQASQAGEGGTAILHSMLQQGQEVGGKQKMNALFGQNVFKDGKLNQEAIGKIDLSRFKGLSKEQMASVTGFEGASGSDFVRFVETFKKSDKAFKTVLGGSNETADQFAISTDNLKSRIDRFRRNVEESGRSVGEGISGIGNALLKGNMGEAWEKTKATGHAVKEHGGTIAGALAATAGVGLLAGGGLGNLLKKVGGGKLGGMGGLVGGMLKGQAAKEAGVTPVYVTNASEIGAGGVLGGGAGAASGMLGKVGGFLGKAGGVAGIGAAAFEGTSMLMKTEIGEKVSDVISGAMAKLLLPSDAELQAQGAAQFNANRGGGIDTAQIATAVKEGASQAKIKVETKGSLTNPSSVSGRGVSR